MSLSLATTTALSRNLRQCKHGFMEKKVTDQKNGSEVVKEKTVWHEISGV
jgi:hypothetical protein